MRAFVVLAAVVACVSANPGLVLNNLGLHGLTLTHAPLARAVLPTQTITYQAAPQTIVQAVPQTVVHSAPAPVVYSAPAVVAPAVTKTQYHAQDELGQASYGHAEPGQAHAAVRDAFGNVAGSYAYINPEGKEVRVSYVADGAGFRVASNDLPVAPQANLESPKPVEDTPEVAEAKAKHLALLKAGSPAPAAELPGPIPQPVQETEEVKAAREAHEKAIAEARAANGDKPQSRRKRGIIAAPIAYSSPAVLAHPTVLAAPAVVAAPAVRQAELLTIHNNPGHAVSYRVD